MPNPDEELILWSLRHNLKVAKTPQRREMRQKQLDDFLDAMERRWEPAKENAMSRFVDKLETVGGLSE